MTKLTLVVMAAGIGSRYGGLKQIDPIGPGGERIIDYLIYDALRAGFEKVVFVIKKAIEDDFRENIGYTIDRQCETAYVFQQVENVPEGIQAPKHRIKPWGTGQATLLCRDVVDGPFAVINADDFYGPISFQTLHNYLVAAGDVGGVYDYCMVGFVLKNTLTENGHVARGVCTVDKDRYLVEIRERTRIEKFADVSKYTEDGGETWIEIPMDSTVSMNMWGFTTSIFDELEAGFSRFFQESGNLEKAEFFLPDVVDNLLKANQARVKVLPTNERWVGVTYRADRPIVEQYVAELVRQGVYPEKLWG